MQIVPSSYGSLGESNDCHAPAGSPAGGQFCSKGGAKVKFWPEAVGAYSGQTDMRLTATVGGEVAGTVDFTLFRGEVTVKMIEVKPEFRRQGIGLALLTRMMEEAPEGSVYRPSMQTPEGSKLVAQFLAKVRPKTEPDLPPTLEPLLKQAAKFDTAEAFEDWFWEKHGDTLVAGRDADQNDEPPPSPLARDLWRELGGDLSREEFWERARRSRVREANDCHTPAGSPAGGQFCSGETVYHGSNVAGITTFAPERSVIAAWFSATPTLAKKYAAIKREILGGTETIYKARANVRKPLHIKGDLNDSVTYAQMRKETGLQFTVGKYGDEFVEGIEQKYKRYHIVTGWEFVQAAKAKGYDSVIATEGGAPTLGVFDATNITMATPRRRRRVRESNDCHNPAGSSVGGQFCSKQGGKAVPLDDALELVNTYTTWSDEDVLDALDSYGIEGRGETDAQRARRERYGEGEGQQALPGDWSKPAKGTAWKDLSVPERLKRLGIEFEAIEGVPGMKAETVCVIKGKDGLLVLDEDGDSKDATEWVNDTDPTDYVDLGDYNEEFWSSDPGETYHATPEENVEDILREGLAPMNKTRGIDNRGTGAAVFTSSEIDLIQGSYGPKVFKIDLSAMRRDGYMPEVAEEEPIMEKRAKEALAAKIGLDDFNWEVESGVDETTLVIFGHIPPKYLELLED